MRNALAGCLLLFSGSLFGAFGDTVKVRTHDKVLIQTEPSIGSTEYPGWGVFPKKGKTWYKMFAELSFQCPAGMNCGEWDYLNFIFIGKRHGKVKDTLNWEVMRFITPYGNQFNQQWKHTWKFDITDFASLFYDSVEVVYQHTGYEAKNGRGWLVTLDFTMIEGPEIRHVAKITPLLRRSVGYGNDSLWDANVPEDTFRVGPQTNTIRYKIIQTGHGMDGNDGCGEFCAKQRYIVFDGKTIDTSLVWRDNCGANPVFPQAGTWIYDRANWCPGAEVQEYNLDIGVEPGSTHTLDMDMQSYQGGGNYMLTLFLVEYGEHAFQNDASLEEVMRPSDELQYLRLNPSCSEPLVKLRNNGKEHLRDVLIEYGWKGYAYQRYFWHGNLAFGAVAEVALPALQNRATAGTPFVARIIWANNQKDEYAGNDRIQSLPNTLPPQHPGTLVINLRTNNAASENYYSLTRSDGTVITKKSNFANNTLYRDTVNLSEGCYLLNLMDDGPPPSAYAINKDGLGWWANTFDGTGLFQLRNSTNNGVVKLFSVDFGTGIWYQFTVGNTPTPPAQQAKLMLYPNPAHNDLLIDLGQNTSEELRFQMYQTTGKKIVDEVRNGMLDALQFVDLSGLSGGVYVIKIQIGDRQLTQKIIKH